MRITLRRAAGDDTMYLPSPYDVLPGLDALERRDDGWYTYAAPQSIYQHGPIVSKMMDHWMVTEVENGAVIHVDIPS